MELKAVNRFERIIVKDQQYLARAIQVAEGPGWIILTIDKQFLAEASSEAGILEAYAQTLNTDHPG